MLVARRVSRVPKRRSYMILERLAGRGFGSIYRSFYDFAPGVSAIAPSVVSFLIKGAVHSYVRFGEKLTGNTR